MAAVISEQDRMRCRYHLDYLGVEAAQTFSLGVPAGMQTQFMIEGAMNRLLDASIPKFHELLDRLDAIECEVFAGIDTATVESLGEITINRKRLKELGQYYSLTRSSVATMLGIVPNPFSQRAWWTDTGINVPVL